MPVGGRAPPRPVCPPVEADEDEEPPRELGAVLELPVPFEPFEDGGIGARHGVRIPC